MSDNNNNTIHNHNNISNNSNSNTSTIQHHQHHDTAQKPLPMLTFTMLLQQQLDIIYTIIKAIGMFYLLTLLPLTIFYSIVFPVCTITYFISSRYMQTNIDYIASIWYTTPIGM